MPSTIFVKETLNTPLLPSHMYLEHVPGALLSCLISSPPPQSLPNVSSSPKLSRTLSGSGHSVGASQSSVHTPLGALYHIL